MKKLFILSTILFLFILNINAESKYDFNSISHYKLYSDTTIFCNKIIEQNRIKINKKDSIIYYNNEILKYDLILNVEDNYSYYNIPKYNGHLIIFKNDRDIVFNLLLDKNLFILE